MNLILSVEIADQLASAGITRVFLRTNFHFWSPFEVALKKKEKKKEVN